MKTIFGKIVKETNDPNIFYVCHSGNTKHRDKIIFVGTLQQIAQGLQTIKHRKQRDDNTTNKIHKS